MRSDVSLKHVGQLLAREHENPCHLLGPHQVQHDGREAVAVRAFLPHAQQAWVVHPQHRQTRPMRRIHPAGLYEAVSSVQEHTGPVPYQLRVADFDGKMTTMHDPYRFPTLLTDFDLHLLGEGNHDRLYEKLGAQIRTVDSVQGVNFAVWAPNAKSVSVVGDFNHWDGRRHPMRKLIPSGVWELFIPELPPGAVYKYQVKQSSGLVVEKTDPFGFQAEVPPCTASVVAKLEEYVWGDHEWIQQRAGQNPLNRPISIYEVHLGSWKQQPNSDSPFIGYRQLAHQLVEYCQRMGYTHIELLPIGEHPFAGSWGYQSLGYFAPTSRHGDPSDLMYLVDYCHQHEIGVILDWVPGHFPKDNHGLRQFDGTALYEHADPRQGEHPDWGTLIFNYGRNEVRNFLLSSALFWLDRYHFDGLRVDAVASMLYLDYSRQADQWIPNRHGGRENLDAIEFIKEFNCRTHASFPGVLTIAEESTAWDGVSRPTDQGGLGFSLKWNMGWMNDSLRYMANEPIHRRFHHDELTFSLVYSFSENFMLPFSHDEVVHGKGSMLDQMPGDWWQKFANLRLLYSYMWTHPGKKLLFMGSDFGQWLEWNHQEELQWDLLQWDTHRGIQKLVADLNQLYRREPALYQVDFSPQGFHWVDCHNAQESTLAYLRYAQQREDFLLVCCNFTPVVRAHYVAGVPQAGNYREIFNSDSSFYGGTDQGNYDGVTAVDRPAGGFDHSVTLKLPPLGVTILKPERQS